MAYSRLIGIVICNYNKCEYLVKCIDSILKSNFYDYDIYVIDNHSEDNSVEVIKAMFESKINVIQNPINLGGSGGFNTGIRKALDKDYRYIMCVDNDIVMEPDNIEKLYRFLEEHVDVGIVGSKICRMNERNRLQELGADIDFDECNIKPHFKNCLDNEALPEVQYCDYVPACSLMIRTEVVHKIGLLPEENFIYWDDMEWGYLAKLAGYRVAAYREAKVYHAMGTNLGNTYFSTYYFWRNRIAFFMKYASVDNEDRIYMKLSEELFKVLYGCYYKRKNNQIKVLMRAFDDAIHSIRGKIRDDKILLKDFVEDRIGRILQNKKDICIEFNGDFKLLHNIRERLGEDVRVTYCYYDEKALKIQYPDCRVLQTIPENVKFECQLVMCSHLTSVEVKDLSKVYIDGYMNVISNEVDLKHFKNYDYNKNLFVEAFMTLIKCGKDNQKVLGVKYEKSRIY